MCKAAWRMPPTGTSPRRWRGSRTAAAWSRLRAPISRRTLPPGATPMSGFRSAAASSSPPPSTAASMPGTARRSGRGSPSSTSARPAIRPRSPMRPASRRTPRRCWSGSQSTFRRGCRWMPAWRCPLSPRRAPFAATSPVPHKPRRGQRWRPSRKASSSTTRRSTGHRHRVRASPIPSTRTMRSRASGFPALRTIRPSSSSRRRWPRSRHPSRATGRACQRTS